MLPPEIKDLLRSVMYFLEYGPCEPNLHEPRTNIDALYERTLKLPYEYREGFDLKWGTEYRARGDAFSKIHKKDLK